MRGLKLIEERYGQGKDNVISLSTIATELNEDKSLCPCIHVVAEGAIYDHLDFINKVVME